VGCVAAVALVFLAVSPGEGSEVSVRAAVAQRTVTVGAEINLSVIVTGSGLRSLPDPELPTIEHAAVYPAGRSTSSSFSLVNGRLSSTNSVTHNYVLVPEKEGELVIGPITVTHRGETQRTAPLTVAVVAAGTSYGASPRPSQRPESADGGGRDLFVELTTDKRRAYVNEQILLTFRFFTRVNLLGQPQYEPPGMTGFWVEPLPKEPSYETVIEGVPYLVVEVRSAVFPTRAGTLTIQPATLRCVVEERDPFSSRDPFDRFRRGVFGMMDRGREVTLRTDPLEIEVKSVPEEGAPPSFEGAVGRYRLTMEADKTSVKEGDPVTLTVTVVGAGNVNTISQPHLPDVPGMRAYDSGARVDAAGSADGLEGRKVYEHVVVPEVSGEFSLGPAEFSYFDPAEERFETLTAGPVQVSVAPGPVAIGPEPELPQRREIRVMSRDVRHIHPAPAHLARAGQPRHRSVWFLVLQVVPVAAYLGAVGYRRHLERLNEDVGYARSRRADRRVRRRFSEAHRHLHDPDSLEFAASLEKATRDFVGDKFNLSTVGMTYDQLEKSLRSRDVPRSLVEQVLDCLRVSEQARFCPTRIGIEERRDLLERAEGVIARLGKHRG